MSLQDILQAAIQQEIDGYHQYMEAAQRAEDPEAKALFLQLAQDEAEHRQLLEAQCRLLTTPPTTPIETETIDQDTNARDDYLAARRMANALLTANDELKKRQSLHDYELQLASTIQKSLLPSSVPRVPKLQVAAHIDMARRVGGDYYDFASDSSNHLWMAIGDVSGKGIPASLLMATARAAWKSIATSEIDQGKVLQLLNKYVLSDFSASESFMSFISALYDPAQSCLYYASAGHNPPIYLPAGSGECRYLNETGPVIGFFEGIEYSQQKMKLSPNDLIVFYTDGVVEARKGSEFFEDQRLKTIILQNRHLDADSLIERIMQEVNTFLGNTPPSDDTTLIVLKRV